MGGCQHRSMVEHRPPSMEAYLRHSTAACRVRDTVGCPLHSTAECQLLNTVAYLHRVTAASLRLSMVGYLPLLEEACRLRL